jgi:membrane fusion protein, multidrug efflux system
MDAKTNLETNLDGLTEPTTRTVPMGRRKRNIGLYLFGLALVAAAGIVAFQYANSSTQAVAAARQTMAAEASRGLLVQVATVKNGPAFREIRLLGDAKAFTSATIFAKISGYLRTVAVDKGDQVHAGQVLAEIDSAELDSQYEGAVADLDYKARLAARTRELRRTGDTPVQSQEQADSTLRMAEETVRNLATMRSYQEIRAPFDGTITARFADPGALMQAATTNQSSSLPLLVIADNSKLRVGIYVEQRDAAAVHVGDNADIIDAANPDRHIKAKISRSASTLDPRTRTLFMEVDVDNRDGFLVAGSFVYVTLRVPVSSYPQVPVAALVDRGGNTLVATVAEDATVTFRPVKIVSTDGIVTNISEGLKAGDVVALNVPNEVTDGARVRPAPVGR